MDKKNITFGDLQSFIDIVNDKKTSYLDKIELYSNYLKGVELSKIELEVIKLIDKKFLIGNNLEIYKINENLYIINFFIVQQNKEVYCYFIKKEKNFLSDPFLNFDEALIRGLCKIRKCEEHFLSICKLLDIKLEENNV